MKKYYDGISKRLVFVDKSGASSAFWEEQWDIADLRENVEKGKDSKFILKTLRKYLPDKRGRILEGGCGIGQVVYCMHVHGYKSIGVDFAKKTIEQVKQVFPELSLIVGDVRNLPFPSNYFVGYWLLGVIEHFLEGYHDILREMQRVVSDDGYVFLTFPHMSPVRKLKAKLRLYEKFDGRKEKDFYQFALDSKTVVSNFESAGFKLLHRKPISGLKGFKDEINLFKPVLQKLYNYKGTSLWIKGLRYILDRILSTLGAGHMMFIVFRKEK